MNQHSSRHARRAEVTRGRLIAAARALLRAPDYASASVSRITELADVGQGSFYNHFASKEALFEAAVHDVLQEQAVRASALIRTVEGSGFAAALSMHLVLQLTADDPEIAEIIARNGIRLLDADVSLTPQGRDIIDRGIADGSFRAVDPELLLAVVGGSLIGGLHTWSDEPARVTAEWRIELVTRALVAIGCSETDARESSTGAFRRIDHGGA